MKKAIKFEPKVCEHCSQTTQYLMPVDRGAAIIVKAVAAAIRRKNENAVHPVREMEVPRKEWTYDRARFEGVLPSSFIRNFSRVRFHGLIARVKGKPGFWCLTTKGADFLAGMPVEHYAIRGKATRHTEGYLIDPKTNEPYFVEISQLAKQGELWEGINFNIVDGQMIFNRPPSNQMAML